MRGIQADGKKIAELRRSLQITQAELAAKAECDVKSIRSAEKGRRLDPATLRRIAEALMAPTALIVRLGDDPQDPQTERRLTVVREWQRAFNDRDVEALLVLYHDDAVQTYPTIEGLPGTGTFRGKEELRRQIHDVVGVLRYRARYARHVSPACRGKLRVFALHRFRHCSPHGGPVHVRRAARV